MKKAFLFLAGVAFVSCSSKDKSAEKQASTIVKTVSAEPYTPWVYKVDTDKATSKHSYIALAKATNKLNFASPYDGGSTGTVMVKSVGKKNEVVLTIDKGKFVGGDEHPVSVKFDERFPIKFEATETSKDTPNVLTIEPSSRFIRKLKRSKKLIVQVEFYASGYKEMEFDVRDLKWNH